MFLLLAMTLLLLLLGVMALVTPMLSDSCGGDDVRRICTATWQNWGMALTLALPATVAVMGVVAAALVQRRRRTSPIPLAILLGTCAAMWWTVTALQDWLTR